ncbi:hypothetical protein [Spiroplasma endosymbiont of Dilophus febrilis]|uniref:hypothetical protein n=1 Tax=Spiroplasma endosymbiont of Dilophus febrilis TaxID=3066292 RepID=UPI00313AC4F5
MFMKIFTVLIISFNNIFTIPQNINNDKSTAQSLIRSKRQNNESYELNLKKSKLTLKSSKDDNSKWNQKWEIKVNVENEFIPKNLPPRMKLNDWEFYVDKNDKITLPILKSLEYDLNWEKNSEPRYWENKDFLSYQNKKLKNIKMKVQEWDKNERYAKWKILEFNAQSEIKPSTDIDLSEKTTKFDGNYNYNDVVDNLDYLMIHRGDFDKFNYSYLYWTPVFNFIDTLEKGYYKEFTIKNYGFKNESYFYHKTSSDKNVVNENVLKIKAFNKTLIAGNKYLQLLHGENEIWKYGTTNSNDYYLIKYLFGTLNYLNVRFSFLRYDPDLKNDIYLYFKNNIPSINNSDYKNVFNEIYEILGNFFASLFYATFDMDEKTHTEIDFKGVENYKKDYFIQIGFFYRSLITFYPKKYLVNIIGNSELLLRSYFFRSRLVFLGIF